MHYVKLFLIAYFTIAFCLWALLFINPYLFASREDWAHFYDVQRRKHPTVSPLGETVISVIALIIVAIIWPRTLYCWICDLLETRTPL